MASILNYTLFKNLKYTILFIGTSARTKLYPIFYIFYLKKYTI